ncbi:MAG: hypothetical protein AB7K52_12525 [Phycisphaerales bacterium]
MDVRTRGPVGLMSRAGTWRGARKGVEARAWNARERMLEQLEPRKLLAMIMWDGGPTGNGTNWHDAANWAGDVLPGPGDDAIIDVGASPTIVFNSTTGSQSIRSLMCAENITISGGTLTIAEASSIAGTFTLSGSGTVTGAGDLSVTGTMNWNGGTMSGAGTTTIEAAATLSMGLSPRTLSRTIEVLGAGAWTSGNVSVANGGTFIIGAGGTLSANASASMTGTGAGNELRIDGTLQRTAGSGTVTLGNAALPISLGAGAVILVSSGTMAFGSAVGYGEITVNAPGTVQFAGAQTHAAGSSISGTGNVVFQSGVHVFEGSLLHDGTIQVNAGATLEFPADRTIGQAFTLSNGTLSGAGHLEFTGTFAWISGTMSGSGGTRIAPGAALALGTGTKSLQRDIENFGTVTVSTGTINVSNAEFVNRAGGMLTATSTNFWNNTAGTNAFVNEGALVLTATSTSTLGMGVPFENAAGGVVTVNGGRFELRRGGTNEGLMSVMPGGELRLNATTGATFATLPGSMISGDGGFLGVAGNGDFAAGTFALTGSFGVSGGIVTLRDTITTSGPVTISGSGEVRFEANQSLATLTLTSGTLSGAGTVVVTGALTWQGGTMSGSGVTRIDPGATLTMNTFSLKTLRRTIENFGTTAWTQGNVSSFDGTFINEPGGVFNLDPFAWNAQGGTSVVRNLGTMNVAFSAGTNGLFVDNAFTLVFENGDADHTGAVINVTSPSGTRMLTIDALGSNFGQIHVGAGVTLVLASDRTYEPGSIIDGDGAVRFTSGTHTFDAALATTGGFVMQSFGSPATTVNFNSDVTIGGATTIAGIMGGSGMVTFTGAVDLPGATLNGSGTTRIAPGATATLTSGGLTLSRTLENLGTTTHLAGQVFVRGGTFANAAGGVFNANSSVSWQGQTGVNAFNNAGTVSVNAVFNLIDFPAPLPFNNLATGVVNVNTFTFDMDSGGSNAGVINIAGGATLELDGTTTHAPGSMITGAGSVRFAGGSHDLSAAMITPTGMVSFLGGTTTIANALTPSGAVIISGAGTAAIINAAQTWAGLALSGGTLDGSGDIMLTGASTWSGGAMSGSGRTIIDSAGVLNIETTGLKTLARTLENQGTANWTGGNVETSGGTLRNAPGGTFNAQAVAAWTAVGGVNLIDNQGLFEVSAPGIVTFTRGSSNLSFFNGGSEGDPALFRGSGVGESMVVDELRHLADMELSLAFAAFLRIGHMEHSGTVSGEGSLTIEPLLPEGTCTMDVQGGQFDYAGSLTLGAGCTANFLTDTTIAADATIHGEIAGPGNVDFAGPATITGTASFTGAGGTRFSGPSVAVLAAGSDREVTFDRPVKFESTTVNLPTGAYTWSVRAFAPGHGMEFDTSTFNVPDGATLAVQVASGGSDSYTWRVQGYNAKTGVGSLEFRSNALQNDLFDIDLGATLDIAAGSATLDSDGTSSGTITGAAGAAVRLGGDWVLDAQSQIAGAVDVFYEDVTAEILGAHTTTGVVTIAPVAVVNFNAPAPVTLTRLELLGEAGGTSDIVVRTLNWHGGGIASGAGTLSGSGEPGSVFNYLSNSGGLLGVGRRFVVTFQQVFPTGLPDDLTFDMNDGAVVIPLNQLLTLDVGLPRQIVFSGSGGENSVEIEGTLNKVGSGAVRIVDAGAPVRVSVAPTGRLNAQAGSFEALSGGENRGVIELGGGATIQHGGLWRYLPGSSLQGDGVLTINDGVTITDVSLAAFTGSLGINTGATLTATVNTDLNAATTVKGLLDGAARVRVTDSLTLEGGSRLASAGGVEIAPGANLMASNSLTPGAVTLATDVDNHGDADFFVAQVFQENAAFNNFAGGAIRLRLTTDGGVTWAVVGTSTIVNHAGATLTAESDAEVFAELDNQGNVIATPTSTPGATAHLSIPNLVNIQGTTLGGGRYEALGLQNPATIRFERLVEDVIADILLLGANADIPDFGTNLRVSGDGSLYLSGGASRSLVSLTFADAAEMFLDAGSSFLLDTLTLGAGTSMTVGVLDLGGTTLAGGVTANGTATVAGTLNVQGQSGYQPTAGDSATILDAGTIVGEFTTVNLPSAPTGLTPRITYTPTSVVYQVDPDTGTVITWTGAAGDGLWRTASNWDLVRLPGAGDDVVIPSDAAIAAVTFDTTANVRSVDSSEPLLLMSGALTVNADSNTFSITLEGTVFTQANGTMTVVTFDTRGGAIHGPGGIIIPGVLTITDGTTSFDSTFFTVSRVEWEGGDVNSRNATFTFTSSAEFNVTTNVNSTWRAIDGSTSISGDFDYVQTGSGTMNFEQNPGASMGIGLGPAGSWTIQSGRTNCDVAATWAGPLTVGALGTMSFGGSGSQFLGGTGTPHQVDGTLEVQSGTLSVARSLTGSGNVQVRTGGFLALIADGAYPGLVAVAPGATVRTLADVSIGTLDSLGTVRVERGTLSAGSVVQLTGGELLGGTWNIGDGSNLPAALNFPAAVTTNQASVSLLGALTTFPQLVGNMLLNSGFLGVNAPVIFPNSIDNTGTFSVPGPSAIRIQGTYTNAATGTTAVSAGGTFIVDIDVLNEGTFGGVNGVVNVGGLFDNRAGHSIGAGTTVTATGGYTGSGASAITTVESGGALDVGAAAILRLQNMASLLINGGSVTGGALVLDRGSVNAAGAQTFQVDSVNTDNESSIDLSGVTVLETGSVLIRSDSMVTVRNGATLDSAGTLSNGATLLVDAGHVQAGGLSNGGDITIRGGTTPGVVSLTGDTQNRGTITFEGLSSFTSTGGYSGEINGALNIRTDAQVRFDGDVNLSGMSRLEMFPESVLDVGGTVTMGPDNVVTVFLLRDFPAPRVFTNNDITLGGTLVVDFLDTNSPMVGQSFEIFAGMINGQFTTLSLPGFPGGVRAELVQTPTQVRIDIVAPVIGTWIGPAGGDWNDPANWAQGVLPGANDDVVIDIPGGTFTITHSGGASSVRSITSQENITLSNGTLTVADSSVINGEFRMTGGTLTRGGEIQFNGGFVQLGGTLAGDGDAFFAPGTTYTIDSGSSPISLTGNFLVQGTAAWMSGNVLLDEAVFTIALGGAFNLLAAGFFFGGAPGAALAAIALNGSALVAPAGGGIVTIGGGAGAPVNLSMAAGSTTTIDAGTTLVLDAGTTGTSDGLVTINNGGILDDRTSREYAEISLLGDLRTSGSLGVDVITIHDQSSLTGQGGSASFRLDNVSTSDGPPVEVSISTADLLIGGVTLTADLRVLLNDALVGLQNDRTTTADMPGRNLTIIGTSGNDEVHLAGTITGGVIVDIQQLSLAEISALLLAGDTFRVEDAVMILGPFVPLINEGLFTLGAGGSASVAGDYSQGSTGAIEFDLTDSETFGRLDIGGTGALAGTLSVRLATGFAAPLGTLFDVITGATTGTFDSTQIIGLPAARKVETFYGSVSLLFTHIADFNNDGTLNPDDLGDFINAYFSSPPPAIADFNGDGDINPDDLGDFINAYFGGG